MCQLQSPLKKNNKFIYSKKLKKKDITVAILQMMKLGLQGAYDLSQGLGYYVTELKGKCRST